MPSLELNLPALLAMPRSGRCWVSDVATKIAKSVHIGRYSAGPFAPRPPRQPPPSLTLQIHLILRWSMRMVPATMFLFGLLSIT
jgi:hypothetical protein